MFGWLLCHIGRHEWWHRSMWPQGPGAAIFTSPANATRATFDRVRRRSDLHELEVEAVCGRCPAKRYA